MEFDVLVISTENDHDFIIENSIITCLEEADTKFDFRKEILKQEIL